MGANHLHVDRQDAVARLRIDRTDHFNSFDQSLAEALAKAAVEVAEDDAIRCVTLTGTGAAFSSGADLRTLAGDGGDVTDIRRLASTLHDALLHLHRAEKPVVTGVNGVAAGAGFGFAISGDLVLVSSEARLEFAYPRIGLAGDCGATFWLPRTVGLRKAMEIVLLDEPITPDEAVELGLATERVPDAELERRLSEVASRLASGPTEAYGLLRRRLMRSHETSLAAQLAAETDAMTEAIRTEDYRRGYEAFFSEDEPEFVGE